MKSKILKFLTLAAALCGATAWGATVAVTTQPELENAVNAANSGDTIKLSAAEYTLYGKKANTSGKALTFIGEVDAQGNPATTWKYGNSSAVNGEGGSDYSFDGAGTITFKNVILRDNLTVNSYYRGFVRANGMVFENCTIKNMMGYLGVGDVLFKNCTFDVESTCDYAVKTYSGQNFTFDGCTFKGNNKGFIQAYMQDATETRHAVVVKDCNFVQGSGTPSKTAVYFYDQGDSEGARWDIDFQGTNTNPDGVVPTSPNSNSWLWGDMKYQASATAVVKESGTIVWENNAKVEAAAPAVAKIGTTEYTDLAEAINAAQAANDNVPVELLSDIDLTGKTWTSVVYSGGKLAIDGKGFTVKGLSAPLLNKQGSGGHELTMSNVTFKDATVSSTDDYAAVIVPYADSMNKLSFTNVTIDHAQVTSSKYAGAFVGYAAGYNVQNDGPVFQQVTFDNCTVKNSTITGAGSTGALMGHAAGNPNAKIIVRNGTMVQNNVITCSDTSSTDKAGSLFGTVGDCGYGYPEGGIEVAATVSGNTVTSGSTTITTIYGRRGSEGFLTLQPGGSYDAQPIADADAAWAAPAEGYVVEKGTGDLWGVVEAPAFDGHIKTLDDLKRFRDMVNAGTSFAGQTIVLEADINLVNEEWTPIGNASGKKFAGTFDGQNHTISGLKITGGSYVGLFGYLGAATVQNVALVGANVSGVKRVGALVGQIAGDATIKNCSLDATSSVAGSDSNTGGLIGEASGSIVVTLENLTNNAPVTNTESGTSRAAGILCQATSGASVTLKNCVNNGTITTNGGYAGGIVSAKQGGASLVFDGCSNTGTLANGTKGTGALLAWSCNGSSVTISNYSGDVANAIGWLSQDNYDHVFVINGVEHYIRVAKGGSGYTFASRYEAAQLMDKSYLQEIIGFFNYAKTVNANFEGYPATPVEVLKSAYNTRDESIKGGLFNTDVSSGWPQLLSQYNATSGKSLTADDFAVTWGTRDVLFKIGDAVAKIGDTYYATLDAAVAAVQNGETITVLNYDEANMTAPDGWKFVTEEGVTTLELDVITISTVEELVAFSAAVNDGERYANKIVRLTQDLDMTDIDFDPIGNVSGYPSKSFYGVFDGQNHTIRNLTVSDTTPNYASAGLFGSLCGTVQNVKLENVNITSSHYAAALVGYSSDGNTAAVIKNCHVDGGTVTSTPEEVDGKYDNGDKVGGLAGYLAQGVALEDCTVKNLTVTAYRDVAGLVGYANTGVTVKNSSVTDTTVVSDHRYNYKDYKSDGEYDANAIIGEASSSAVLTGNTFSNVDFEILENVAKIGNSYYATLDDAIAAAQDGEVIDLLANTTLSDYVLDKSVTIRSAGETRYEIKGLKAIAGSGAALENVFLNLDQTLDIGGTDTMLKNCVIRAKDVGYWDIVDGKTTGFTGGEVYQGDAFTYLVRVSGTRVALTDCRIDGTDKDESYFPNMCLAPVSGTDVTMTRCTFNEGFAACYYSTPSGTWTLEDCTFTKIYCYNIHAADTAAKIVVKGCSLAGWTSFGSSMAEVSFENCAFAKSSGFATLVAYKNATFSRCTFTEDYKDNLFIEANTAVDLNGCSVVDGDGQPSATVSLPKIVALDDATAFAALDATKDADGKYTAGKFVASSTEVLRAHCAAGYEPVTNGDGTYSIKPYVAQIGETKFLTLEAAVEAAKIGDTITIIANDASLSAPEGWTISGSTLIPVDKTWHIANLDQLKEFQSAVNGGNTFAGQTVVLDADIDMASVVNWQPIGNASGKKFAGTFDGNNKTIYNLKVTATANYAGLFGCVFGARIKDLNLVDAVVSTTGENYAGALVGGGYAHIENCSVTGGSVTGVDQVGGVIGYLSCGSVKNCTVDGVAVTANGDRAGGIAGKANVDSEYEISGNTVKDAMIVAAKKIGEMRSAAGLVGQVMASASNTWSIKDNTILNTTTKTGDDTTFVPVGEFRDGCYQADAVTAGHIVNNHWEPATPDAYDMKNPANAEQFVTIENYWEAKTVVVTDTASAQAALDAATPNTTIIFKSGTYEPLFIRQTLAMSTRRSDLDMDGSYPAYLRSFKNLTLIAEEGAEVISQGITAEAGLFWHDSAPASNQAEMNRATSGFISYLALENVTIDGIAFDSSERSAVTLRDNGAVATRGNIMVDGLTIQNCTGRGVASNKNIHFLAAGAGTNDQNFPGTEKKAFNNLVVKNCELDSYYQPIAFNNATAVLNGLTVTGNTFRNCADNQLQVANKINTGTFTITGNVFDGMSGRVIRLTNAQADSQFIITGNEIRNPKTYDSGLDSYSLTKITGVDGFRVTEQTDKGWTAGSYSADGKTWVADGDKKLLVYTYDAGMLKLGLVPLTDDEVAAFTGVNVQGLKGYDNKVYPTIQAAYDELSALVAAAGVGADGVVANDKVTGLYSQIDGNKIGISWNVWGEQVLPMGDTLALGRGQGYLGSYWIRNLSIKGRNEAAQVTASKITVPWSWQYPEVNDEESVILSISGLKLLDVDTTGISFARNGIGLAGTFTLNMTRCQVSGGINMAGAYQGNSVWNINDNVFTYRTGGYKQYAIMLNGTTAGDVAKGRSTTMNFIGNTVSGYDRGVNFSWVGGSVTASGNTITPGVGYSAIQLSNGVGTTQINGNTIHLNGGNVLTIHESCVGKTMSITVQGNAFDGTGYAVYDDVAASGKDYGSSADKANVTLVWSGNGVADGAAMDTEKGIKGTSETDLSEYVYTVLNPAGARVRHGDTVTRYPTLAAAIAAAQQGDTVELIREGTYTLPAIPLNITIKGTVEGVAFNCPGAGNIASVPNGATFENVEFTFGNSGYHGFQHAGLITMNNCTLNGLLFSYGDMAFNGCTFVQEENEYCMWCYSHNVTYTECTFNTAGKALNVYNESDDADSPWNITVSGCTFNSSVKNKAAVNIKETCGAKMLKYNVTVTDCTIGTPDFYPTGAEFNPANALWVISPLVQVDDRNTSVYPSESGITVTMGDECVYPMATMLQLPVSADGGTKLLLTVPDTFFTGVVTYPAGATADEKSEIQSAYLATVEANGLKVWQNYVMGVNGSVAGNKLLTDYVVGGGEGAGEWITLKTPIAAFNPPTDSGITVKYRLLRTMTPDGATSWVAFGELKDTPSFPVNIAGQEGDTFWKIEVVFQGEAANE